MEDEDRKKITDNLNVLVERTNDDQFKKLRDEFFNHKMINQWMVNKIDIRRTMDDKKRLFYGMIPKRGPKAFPFLIEKLNSVGLQRLAAQILTAQTPAIGDNFNIVSLSNGRHRSDGITESDGNTPGHHLRNTTQSPGGRDTVPAEEAYLIKSKPKGIVLIINIETIKRKNCYCEKKRNGSINDEQRLEKVWKELGYKVITKRNLIKEKFKNTINKFIEEEELKKVDSVLVFVMTHGLKHTNEHARTLDLETYDGESVNSEWIIERFNNYNCKKLAHKPKVLFFQACRGDSFDVGIAIETDGGRVSVAPTLSDVLVVYSTSPGFASGRDPINGGYFTQYLCDVLEEKNTREIFDIINAVSRKMKRVLGETLNMHQIVHYENFGFDRKMYIT